jgi:alkyl hydroperoxide reductase subunit AhpC
MKLKIFLIVAAAMLVLAACGTKTIDESVTLLDNENNEVNFPQEKPVLFFFMTTYTWGICQQQLVELHNNLEVLDGVDMEMYVISKDQPEEQKLLHDELEKTFGQSLPFISDPELELIDRVGMKNGDVAYRGYAIIAPDGQVVLKQVNDYWGQELDKTVEDIKEAYDAL